MSYSVELLQMLAQPDAYARRPPDLVGYIVRSGGQQEAYPVGDFDELISRGFVGKLDGGEWAITAAGRVQAQCDKQAYR